MNHERNIGVSEVIAKLNSKEFLLKEWQERLGLTDWVIILKYNCKNSDMENENAVGEVSFETTNKSAIIRIISKEAYEDEYILSYDFENALVHELLHLKFSVLDKEINSYESVVTEQVRHQLIDDLARAFVMTKRNQTKRQINCDIVQEMNVKKEGD